MASIQANVYTPAQVRFKISEIADRPEPLKVLMCTPDCFDIVDEKNVHMKGQQGKLDRKLALQQWQKIHDSYLRLKKDDILTEVLTVQGSEGCEDMVFAANQSFPWITENGEKIVILSKMRHASRQREVEYFKNFYIEQGYRIIELSKTDLFEGMGDAIPHPGKRLLYGGYGHRTNKNAYKEISALLNVPIVLLELTNENFYHLDTCFIPLGDESVLLFPGAFKKEDLDGIKRLFKEVIEIPEKEALKGFALNAHIVTNDGNKVAILQKDSPYTVKILKEKGFDVIETDTSEYIKSGGSVFCMKMMMY